jgi:hypothetical protein
VDGQDADDTRRQGRDGLQGLPHWTRLTRRGRRIVYALHDPHVADLLDQAVFHVEHVRLGYAEPVEEIS